MIKDFIEGLLNTGDLLRDIKKLRPLPGMGIVSWIMWTFTLASVTGVAVSPLIAYFFGFTTFAAWVCTAAALLCFGLVGGRRARLNYQQTGPENWGRSGW